MSVSPVPRPGGRSRRGRLLASSGALIAAVLMLSAAPAVQAQAPAAYAQEPGGSTGQDLSGGADSLPLMIDRFAGGGFGEGGPAVEAALVGPTGMAADGQGNLYIADSGGDRLLKVDAEGTVTAVANADAQPRMCRDSSSCPGGVADYESVDGLPARDAGIQPYEVAVEPGGDLLVLEAPNSVCSLHRIDAETGIIDTLIESPQGCHDRQANPVDGPIESATMAWPKGGMVVGPDGSLYFVDLRQVADEDGPTGTVIRRIDPSFTTVSTVAGGGDQEPADGMTATDARLANPGTGDCGDRGPQVAVDPEGLLHFTCTTPGNALGWGRIWRVEESGALRLVAGGGPCCERRDGEDAAGAFFESPGAMVFVGEGGRYEPGIYVGEGRGIRRISPDGKAYTFAEYPNTPQSRWTPELMVMDSAGRMFAAGGGSLITNYEYGYVGPQVNRIGPDGTATRIVGNGLWSYYGQDDGTPATEAGFGQFSKIAADAAGNVYVRDRNPESSLAQRAVVRRIDADTGQVTRIAGIPKSGPLKECRPEVSGPALDAVICNYGATENGIAVDSAGNVYLTAGYEACRSCSNPSYYAIYRVDAQTGTIDDIWSCGGGAVKDLPTCVDGAHPTGLHVDDSDTVFFSQEGGRVNRLNNGAEGWVATTIADVRATGGGLGDLTGDAQGRLYVANDSRVYRVEPDPGDLTGLVWTVTPVAGTGERGFSGDGGPATEAQLYWAAGVAVDAGGNLLIADWVNMRVRRVDAGTGIITTIAGDGACCTVNGVGTWAVGAYSGDGGPAATASLTGPTAVTVLPDGRLLITDGRKLRVIEEERPVTFADLRQQVETFRDAGAVTQSAAKRMLSKVDRAETAANSGDTTKAIELLDEFKQIAAHPKHVPDPDAREVLIGLADRLITQLRSGR